MSVYVQNRLVAFTSTGLVRASNALYARQLSACPSSLRFFPRIAAATSTIGSLRWVASAGNASDDKKNGPLRPTPFAAILGFSVVFSALLTVVPMIILYPFVLAFDRSRRRFHITLAMFWMRLSFFLARVRVKVAGTANLPSPQKGALFVANCQSPLDMFVAAALPRPVQFLIPSAALRVPVIGWIMKLAQWIGVAGADRRSQMNSLATATDLLARGGNLIMFPEAGPSVDGKLAKFSPAPFRAARKSGVPIVPVTLSGSGAMFSSNTVVPSRRPRGPIRMTIHSPIFPLNENDSALSEAAFGAIASALTESK